MKRANISWIQMIKETRFIFNQQRLQQDEMEVKKKKR